MAEVAVIIVAAGRGHRFGAPLPKQYATLKGAPVVRHAVARFLTHPDVDLVQPVIHPDDAALFADALEGLSYLPPVAGGETRQESVLNGLRALAPHAPSRVLVHDAARPNIDASVIGAVIDALEDAPGALPAVAVSDTLKRARADGRVLDTVPRDGLWRAQTPQGFRFDLLLAAHESVRGQALTDDAAVMEAAGHHVVLVPGGEDNVKITTAQDLTRMEAIMLPGHISTSAAPAFRIGSGFDVHRLGPGGGVIICGVEIACQYSLIGHSDADVGLHAITDAILGAIAEGDIGSHFPPSDDRWKGAASDVFLHHALELTRDKCFDVANIDVTLICERPKIGPYRDAMRSRIAEIAGLDAGQVSVKATTTERLGFTGRGEGIAAQASVLISGARTGA